MSYVVDGSIDAALFVSKEESGAVFGPDVTETWQGSRAAVIAKREALQLDARGVAYEIARNGDSPLWNLVIRWTRAESDEDITHPDYDSEAPVNIIWRLTAEFAEIDFRKMGRFQYMMDQELTSDERRDLNKLLEELLGGTATSSPAWIPDKPPLVQAKIQVLISRYERGKSTTHVHFPVLTRDASFRAGADYRASMTEINVLLTSAQLITRYPEIPQQFRDRMPSNGWWKITRNDWETESTGSGRESMMFTWDEWYDPEDNIVMLPPTP